MANLTDALRSCVRVAAKNHCGYCLVSQEFIPWILEIEHIIPVAKGGSDAEDNLWLACRSCNLFKGSQTHAIDPLTGRRVRLFNPRQQRWHRHFLWSDDGTLIIGRTTSGRATVFALNLNNLVAVTVRRNWVSVGWHPPTDI
jgi:hypothetical protein